MNQMGKKTSAKKSYVRPPASRGLMKRVFKLRDKKQVMILFVTGFAVVGTVMLITSYASSDTSHAANNNTGFMAPRIRACESGDGTYGSEDYTAQSSFSTASGAYQFINGTWGNYRGYPTAKSAPRDVQDARFAEIFNNGSGKSHWIADPASVACWAYPGGSLKNGPSFGDEAPLVIASVNASIHCPISKSRGITRVFHTDPRPHPITGSKKAHHGIDIAAGDGDGIYAAQSGRVSISGRVSDTSGYGLQIDLNGSSYNFKYAHLLRINPKVLANPNVTAGQLLGYTDSSGAVTGSHLHFEMRKGNILQDPAPHYRSCGGGGSSTPVTGGPPPTIVTQVECHREEWKRGEKGLCVEHIQAHLQDLGYGPELGPDRETRIDGIFGLGTELAVKKFKFENKDLFSTAKCTAATYSGCSGVVTRDMWVVMHDKMFLNVDPLDTGAVADLGPKVVPRPGGIGGDYDPNAIIVKPPQPGTPGQAGASIGQGTGGQGGAGGTATGNNTVGGDGGAGGSGACTGGCKPGQSGTSTPGQPGTSNPGTATQGSPGSPGASGAQGSSGTSGTSGQQGSKGSQGGVSIGGQSQGSSYSGSTKTSCKNGTCTTTTPDGKTTTTSAASSTDKPPAVAQYVIRSHASGRCMDADGIKAGKDTQIWDCHGGTNQKWGLATDGTIRLAASGLCLEVEGGKTKNGTDVQIYDCNGGSHQRWQWNSDGTIRSAATGRCLDVKDNKIDNGANLQVWDCVSGAKNQKWGTW